MVFPTSKAEERILVGPELCHGLNNQLAMESIQSAS